MFNLVAEIQEDSFNYIEAAREWLLDCFQDEYDQETIRGLNDSSIVDAINRYYHDGIEAFNESCE
jgi:hypothetical protein